MGASLRNKIWLMSSFFNLAGHDKPMSGDTHTQGAGGPGACCLPIPLHLVPFGAWRPGSSNEANSTRKQASSQQEEPEKPAGIHDSWGSVRLHVF
jgi:hypothetical protein